MRSRINTYFDEISHREYCTREQFFEKEKQLSARASVAITYVTSRFGIDHRSRKRITAKTRVPFVRVKAELCQIEDKSSINNKTHPRGVLP